MAVAEFVFGELFQEKWVAHVTTQVPHLDRWSPIQKERYTRLLEWKVSALESGKGSPWNLLKAAKPDADLFVRAR